MHGLMMDTPLLITSLMRHADRHHANQEIVSITLDNPSHRYTYREAFTRVRQLANALAALGLNDSDRVGTLAWNDYRHFELYYAVSCSGFVLHTINPRLFPEQVIYIINHANDRVLFVDPLILPLVEAVQEHLTGVEHFIIMTDEAHMPQTSLPNAQCYETLIAGQPNEFEWPELDENSASALCYTSGTTGNPKGVLYSHRSTILHCYGSAAADVLGLRSKDIVLPVVPMFHVNAWGIPYACPMVGAKLVFPGPKMGDGETLATMMNREKVTISLGVPTVWLALLSYCKEAGIQLESMERTVVGGAACPISLMDQFREEHDVHVHQGWGMTEMSPLGTQNVFKAHQEHLSLDERRKIQAKQGRGLFGVELKITDDDNQELPWDGKAFGALKVRGPWVCSAYYQLDESEAHDKDGWFDTGDVATIDPDGFMQITDRSKDVIKSGGEWISSIDLENAAMDHPAVAEAAVIAVPHPKWTERPLLVVVKASEHADKDAILASLEGKVAKWWIPEDVVFIEELPHTATGKISKKDLREQLSDYDGPASR